MRHGASAELKNVRIFPRGGGGMEGAGRFIFLIRFFLCVCVTLRYDRRLQNEVFEFSFETAKCCC
jgi:hypothetical protein